LATNLLYPVSNCHAHDLFNIYLFIILPSSRWSNLQAGTTRAEYLPMYKRADAVIRYRVNYIFAYVTCSSAHEGVLDCFSGASAYVCCMKHLSTHCTSALCMQQLLDVAHDKFSLHILHFCKTCRCIVDAFVRQAFHSKVPVSLCQSCSCKTSQTSDHLLQLSSVWCRRSAFLVFLFVTTVAVHVSDRAAVTFQQGDEWQIALLASDN